MCLLLCRCLRSLCVNADNATRLAGAGAVPPLLTVLRHAPPDCLLAAAGCLIPIAIWQPKLISIHGGVPLLVRMLNAPLQPLSRLSAVQILAQLVVDETDCGRLVDGGGLHPLLALALDGRGQRKNKAGSAAWERHTRDAARKSTAGSGRPDQTSEFSSSVTSIRLIFGRIDRSHRVFEARPTRLRRNCRVRSH
jgi:hypothetical protein